MSDITVTQCMVSRDYKVEYHDLLTAHRATLARIRELEAENDKLRHDIAAYVQANADLLDECDAARGRALEEAATLIDHGVNRGIARKVDTCAHGKFGWEDCEPCAASAIRALIKEG